MKTHRTSLRRTRNAFRIGLLATLLLVPRVIAADTNPPPPASPPPAETTPASDQLRPGERFEQFFAPWRTEIAALSPDGKLLAYSLREADVLHVLVVEVANPSVAKTKVAVISDKQATPALSISQGERVPARINWMRWATPTRLVLETNRIFATLSGASDAAAWSSLAGEVVAFDADGGNVKTLADAKRVSPESAGGFRAPRVLGFDAGSPESILVLGYRPPRIGRYSIHTSTGKMDYLDEEILDPRMTMMLDRTGKPRIGVPYDVAVKFPLALSLDTGKFGRPFRPLDEIAAAESLAPFTMDPRTFFGERSVPLGFDATGKVLYFASNGGRDTFGIYALDLTTGKKTSTTIENPALDLWEPVPGVFPDMQTSWYSEAVDLNDAFEATDNVFADAEADTDAEAGDEAAPESDALDEPLANGTDSRVSASILPARNTDDRVLVFDRHTDKVVGLRLRGKRPTTHWFRPELREAQALLEERFRPNTVEIHEWDSAAENVLVSVSGPAHAGSDYVFNRFTRSAFQFGERAPWLDTLTSPQMLGFAFESPQGVPISGLITVPKTPRQKPIPVVILTPRTPWQSFQPVYRTEVHALADMGFAVVEYSGRGAWGRGRVLRERLREGYEDAQVEDLLATVDYVASHFAIAPKRLAVAGIDHGGHVALRALELAPERFRCAIAINAPVNLHTWLEEIEWTGASASAQLLAPAFGDSERRKDAPLVRDLEKIQRPALMFNFRGPLGANSTSNYNAARQFAASLRRRVPESEIVDLAEDYMDGLPKARAAVFARIEAFLNANVYDYTVKAGELQVDEPK